MSFRDYLSNHTLWDVCTGPGDIVTWHLTLFCILLITGLVQIGLCAFQVINGLIGTICGDCCGCCGVRLALTHLTHKQLRKHTALTLLNVMDN